MYARLLAVVTLIAALVAGCNPPFLLRPGETAVQQYRNPERFLLIVSNLNSRDSLWHSPYCRTDTTRASIHQMSVGDSIRVLEKFNLSPDLVFLSEERDTLYRVFRLNAWLAEDQSDRECFYLVSPIDNEPNRRSYEATQYIDLDVLDGVISRVEVKVWMH